MKSRATTRRLYHHRILCGACALAFAWPCVAQDAAPAGLVVEEVAPGLAGARAGIEVGDRLLEWRRGDAAALEPPEASGVLDSPFDLRRVEIAEAPRGATELIAERDGRRLTFAMRGSQWGIEGRPAMDERALEAWRAGRRAMASGDTAAAVAAWSNLAGSFERRGELRHAAWAWAKLSDVDPLSEASRRRFARALAVANVLGPEIAASLWEARAQRLEATSDPAGAGQAWQQAIDLRQSAAPAGSLALANDLYLLGTLEGRRGDLDVSEGLLSRALKMRRELAPGSLQEAEALTATGIPAALRGDLELAAERFEQALAIAEQNDPAAGEAAAALNALGNVAQRRGRLIDAAHYYRRALDINEQIDPDGLNVSFQLNNLGFVAELRGDLARAEALYRRALAIKEEKAPGTMHVPRAIENLAFVAFMRGDLAGARDLHRRALPLYEELAPGSLVVATSLKLLANVSLESGDLEGAQAYFERARELEQAIAPETLSYSEILHGLGRTAERRGDADGAQALYSQALALRSRIAPGSLEVAEVLEALGGLALERQGIETAEARYRTAVSIRSRLAPGTAGEAEALHALGTILRATERTATAVEHYRAALDALEAQRGKLGGTDVVRTRFAARYGYLYKGCIELLLALGEPVAAFDVLERYRARGLLAMLAERDLLLDGDLPADVAERRAAINGKYDQLVIRLHGLDDRPEHAAEIESLRVQLRSLRAERENLAERIRVISPRLAAAEAPRPLDLDAVYENLDPGTALLSYAVADGGSWLFALHKGPAGEAPNLAVFPIDLGEQALRDEITAVRTLMQVPGAGEVSRRALIEHNHRLYEQLIEPAREVIAPSERLLIIPDGALHLLSFAALVAETGSAADAAPRYLVEDKAIHTAVSATVHAQMRRAAGPSAGLHPEVELVAFADPEAPDPASRDDDDATLVAGRRGREAGALPYARREIESIAALYRPSARLYVGKAASEHRAKTLEHEAPLIHFASHAVLDADFPLNSYLLLSPSEAPGGLPENGLLQAWEIFEQMRIDADLVTLSACDTGIGAQGGGEGLIGLTRAFQYAGARAVLASLWPISDRSTSLLMRRFYENFERGMPKDEALRAAQVELIRHRDDTGAWPALRSWLGGSRADSDLSHPFHWAAFRLSGYPR